MGQQFTVTEQHIALLKRSSVRWDDSYFGAPAINAKRPYGNSDVLRDIAETIGLDLLVDDGNEKHLSSEQTSHCKRLHLEMETVLQILVANCAIGPGIYEQENKYDGTSWRKAR